MSENSPITAADRLFQGEDKILDFAVVDAAGAPQDLTGFTLLWKLFEKDRITEVLAKTPTIVALDGAADGARVQLEDTDTIAADGDVLIAAGMYWYELWKVNEGDEHLLASGAAYLHASGRRQEVAP